MYKITKGHEGIEWVNASRIRSDLDLNGPINGVGGKSQRIQRESFKARNRNGFSRSVTVRHNFFLNRVAPIWNKLPENVVYSPSLNSLKSSLDEFIKDLTASVLIETVYSTNIAATPLN